MPNKTWLFILTAAIPFLVCCKKDKSMEGGTSVSSFPACKPFPLLTSKVWTADTITINAPNTYTQLTVQGRDYYNLALRQFKGTQIKFNDDCSVLQLAGDWDFGFYKWVVTNNDKDISIKQLINYIYILYNFTVSATQFTYQRTITESTVPFSVTYIFK